MAYLAIDLGAGSGRVMAGVLADGRLALTEVHRFHNKPVTRHGTLYWDWPRLCDEIFTGIRRAVEQGFAIDGIGVDTWGVDFALVAADGTLTDDPVCYRDERTAGSAAAAERLLPKREWYALTGIQQMEINTAYQLLSLHRDRGAKAFPEGVRLLFTPDLVNFLLTGVARNEYTIASTSQLLDARRRDWSDTVFERLGIPRRIMQPIVMPGTCLGTLNADAALRTGAAGARVFAVGAHDTASAIAALPAAGDRWAFLSCGTWSLLGVTASEPVLTDEALAADFTNEGGVGGRILFLRNITGLWILQRLMAEWDELGVGVAYDAFATLYDAAEPFRTIIDVEDGEFVNPPSMAEAIRAFCRQTRQPEPDTPGAFLRCVIESLALKYRFVIGELERCTGRSLTQLHVVGGGSRNERLMQAVADATGLEVVTSLPEATAVGNILQQALADGAVADWDAAHAVVGRSFPGRTFRPADRAPWAAAAERFPTRREPPASEH